MAPKFFKPTIHRYPHTSTISTRWSDNDQYGHLNNAIYYHFYDALINSYMIEHCGWHPQVDKNIGDVEDHQIGLVVSSSTEYFEIVEGFPKPLKLGLGVVKLGHSSVEYEIGVFQGDEFSPAKAVGRFVHVFVDQSTDKTRKEGMPKKIREGLSRLLIEPPASKL